MGCSSCSIDGVSTVAGCKSNGGCQTGGCNKMNNFDWLSDMTYTPADLFPIAEIRFKNGRKDFFRNVSRLNLTTGDCIIVDVPNGHHLGYVSLMGELVRLQMMKKGVQDNGEIKSIYRLATQRDKERYEEVRKREMPTLFRTRQIIQDLNLQMKLSDIEYQADNTKATFYYSADERVDFRELIKHLAAEFKIRVEMKQISLRQEAGRLGGIGSCGRELCCSTWLSEFKSVSTSSARYQNLSLNPSKLSGQCGRLKCCLNYELDTYMDALSEIPKINEPLLTEKGEAKLVKTDIFKKIMWFGYDHENAWVPVEVNRVHQVISLNAKGKRPATLQLDKTDVKDESAQALNSDLERLDRKYKKTAGRKKKKKRNPRKDQRP